MFIDIIIFPAAVFRIICGQSRSCQKYFGGTENSSKKRYTSFRIKMQEHILSNINSVLHHNGSKIECESTIVTSYFNRGVKISTKFEFQVVPTFSGFQI